MACAAKALETLAAPATLPWSAWARDTRADYEANLKSEPPPGSMDLAEVVKAMQRVLHETGRDDAVFTNGAGNYSGWLHRYCQYAGLASGKRSQLAPTAGAMGYGVPAAVAASLLQPGRTVVNMAGDGDFLMTGQELATASAYRDASSGPLVVILVDNASYGTIRMHQEREFPGRVSGSELSNPDFAMLARAYGWAAASLERTEQFEPAFREALVRQQPTLLHVRLDAEVITSRTTLSALRAHR
jgi:acetolactate synthase-1/2/3 large subunit